jgi:hypothetical protein
VVEIRPRRGRARASTILDGPGLALRGATNPDALQDEFLPNDVIGVGTLRQQGYNVVTWDPRGEWSSGGRLEINSPDFEAKDVSAIISWLATTQPEVQLDNEAALDPSNAICGSDHERGLGIAKRDSLFAGSLPTRTQPEPDVKSQFLKRLSHDASHSGPAAVTVERSVIRSGPRCAPRGPRPCR